MRQAAAIWIDVEDLFQYVRHNARPSGIQRLTFELYVALQERGRGLGRAISFVRIDDRTDEFRLVPWEQVLALFSTLARGASLPVPRAPVPGRATPRDLVIALQDRLTGVERAPFRRFVTLQLAALRSLRVLGRETLRGGGQATPIAAVSPAVAPDPMSGPSPDPVPEPPSLGTGVRLLDVACPGDWLLSLGASWHRADYGRLLARARRAGLLTGMLFYDLIPLRRPEWCHRSLVALFGTWLTGVLPALDLMLAISEATAVDLGRLLVGRNTARPGGVRALPIGTGFPSSMASLGADPVPDQAVPPPASYVLFVSTIEARKNHALMFQVWRRLLATLPPAAVPTLVFAGRVGWLVSDLMVQIANTNYCDGKLLIVEDPTDAMLTRLYQGCLFTVLPSLHEGWGLPVTESLAAGKPCITSNLSALPEAGGGLTRVFDPFDLNDAVRVIGGALADREGLACWEAEIRRRFVPVPWTDTADALLRALDAHVSVAADSPSSEPGRATVTHGA